MTSEMLEHAVKREFKVRKPVSPRTIIIGKRGVHKTWEHPALVLTDEDNSFRYAFPISSDPLILGKCIFENLEEGITHPSLQATSYKHAKTWYDDQEDMVCIEDTGSTNGIIPVSMRDAFPDMLTPNKTYAVSPHDVFMLGYLKAEFCNR
ncbi:MAG: hypothetical protein ACMXYK_03810 [Candidatus Woesearchaeota archaeon]